MDIIQGPYGDKSRFFELFAYPMKSPDTGEVLAIIELIREITEKYNHRKELEISETNFKNFFNSSKDFHWILDKQGNILDCNATVLSRLNYTKEELVGQNILITHPENKRQEAIPILTEILDGKRDTCFIPFQSKDKKQIHVETYIWYGNWNSQDVIFAMSKDLSELKLSEEKFATAFTNSPDILGISDLETGEYIEVNKTFYEKLGFTSEEVIHKKASKLLKLDEQFRKKTIPILINKGSIRNIETIITNKFGKKLNVLLSAELITIQDRKLNFTTAVDITDLKNAENAILKQNDKYAKLNNEYIKLNEQLVQAKTKAEEADQLKSAFLANMSHEIRTPMNAIVGFASFLLEEDFSNEEKLNFAKTIIKNGDYLLKLINDIIDLSKINAGQVSISNNPTDITKMCIDMADLFKALIKNKTKDTVELILNIPHKKCTINTDEIRLKQVIINLINNAIKFTDKGIIEFGFEEASDCVKFFVKDSGIGISKNKIKEIFERFNQASEQTEKLYGGTGLGLAISKSFVELLGGQIWVDSEPDIGSTFHFTIAKK
jgi:PAS domain S-box-containing protein